MRALCIATVLIFGLLTQAQAADVDPSMEEDIRQLIAVTGGANLATQMAQGVGNAFFTGLKKQNPQIPDRVGTVIIDQMTSYMREKMDGPDGLLAQMVPIYARNLTHEEIRQLLAFYKTPLGLKLIQTLPQILRESMVAGQTWTEARLPEMQQRIQEALAREGLLPSK